MPAEEAGEFDPNPEALDFVENAVQAHVRQIWDRARSNAFAHRYAAENYRGRATALFVLQTVFGILGILLVLGVYIVSSSEKVSFVDNEVDTIILTFSAVVASILSLFSSILQNYLGYEKLEQLHDHNQHSYLHIAQRAREVRFPDIAKGRSTEILQDLERDFQVLKARGKEPSDRHFTAGDLLLEKIENSKAKDRQSFSN